ncbi:MAG: OmpA family protein [Chitinophagales bacterium]|nr:OmpA family protein [Chitinophagales bacterium]
MSRIIFKGLCILSITTLFSQTQSYKNLVLLFAKDIDTLNEKEKLKLGQFIKSNKEQYIVSINMSGHTDGDGSSAYNIALSNRRTIHIKKLLQEYSVVSDIFSSSYFGENKLLNRERNEIEKSQNRRVELNFQFIHARNIQDIVNVIQPDFNQIFQFSPEKIKLEVKGKKGTKLEILRQDLVYEDGSPLGENDEIKVKLNEIQSFMDQLQANISTETHDGKILESGGMFNVSLTSNEKELKLAPGKEYKASLPNKFKTDNMFVFKGKKSEYDVIKWEKEERRFDNVSVITKESPKVKLNTISIDSWYSRPKLSHFLIERDYNIKIPETPIVAKYPCEPKKPHINEPRYSPNLFQKIIFNTSREDSIRERKYSPAYNDYLKKLARFEKRYDKKKPLVERYNEATREYNQAVRKFNDDLDSLYKDIINYKLAWLEREYIRQLSENKDRAKALASKDSFFQHNFDDLIASKSAVIKFKPNDYYKSLVKLLNNSLKEFYEVRNPKAIRVRQFKGCSEDIAETNRRFYSVLNALKDKSIDSAIVYLDRVSGDYVKKDVIASRNVRVLREDFFRANLSSFTWFNCDRYYNVQQNKLAEYKVINAPLNEDSAPLFYAIIPKINSSVYMHNSYVKLPDNLSGLIVSYFMDAEKRINYAEAPFSPEKERNLQLSYKILTKSELEDRLKKL